MAEVGLEDVWFSYYGGPADSILQGCCHEFRPGALTTVRGRSGVGKSTLLFLLGLLLRPTAGVVRIDGRIVSSSSDAVRSRVRATQIGFLFQDSSLDERRSVLANVIEPSLYSRVASTRRIRERAEELVDALGLEIPLDRQAAKLSGGQMQRLALARAVIMEPEILLADEPTGNLDVETGGIVLSYLSSYARSGRTIIVITHSSEVAARADERLVVESGALRKEASE